MSKWQIYLHIVWATKHREPLITPEIEARLYPCILKLVEGFEALQREKQNVQAIQYKGIAINGMPDHIHLLIKLGPHIDVSGLMKHIKGNSSAFINENFYERHRFNWQEGYSALSVTPAHLHKVQDYIGGQKEHHASGSTYTQWEETYNKQHIEIENQFSEKS